MHCHWCYARKRLAGLVGKTCLIAGDKRVWVSVNAQIFVDDCASLLVYLQTIAPGEFNPAHVPAAQSMVEAWIRSAPTSTPSSSILVTRLFGQTCTPSFSKARVARLACFSVNDGRIRGPDSMRMTLVSLVSILRKSLASVNDSFRR